jgi:putative ABC transport system permease protein
MPFRTWRGNFGLTFTVLLTIALGIGATTAIFTIVYSTLLAPSPYPQPDQLVMVWSKPQDQSRTFPSPRDFMEWKRQGAAFQDLNAWRRDDFNVATPDHPEFIQGIDATPGYNRMFGYAVVLGRDFLPEEGQPGNEHVVILTHRFWRHLGSDPKVIGQKLRANGDPRTVVGVLAEGIPDRWDQELIAPLIFKADEIVRDTGARVVVGGRLQSGLTLQQAQAAIHPTSEKVSALVEPLKNDFFPRERQSSLWLLLGAVGFLLLIACVNVANLLLAKGMTRHREVAIRGALGAKPSAIFKQFLGESLTLAIAGGLLGLCAGYAMLRSLVTLIPPHTLPDEADPHLNIPVLLLALAVTTLAGVLFGCAPAWAASRVDPAEILKEGGRAGTGVGRHRLRRLLVIAEFALALPLLAAAALTIRSFWNLTHVDLGVRTDHILSFYLESPAIRQDRQQINGYYRNVLASIVSVPGVSHASAFMHVPLDGLYDTEPFTFAGQTGSADLQTATPDYSQTFGIRIVKGRTFTDADNEMSPNVVMVNEAFVAAFLKGLDPLEQVVTMQAKQWKIVGVFHTVKNRGARDGFPQIAASYWQLGPALAGIGVRTAEDPATMTKAIAAAVNAVDSQAAFALTRTMDQVHDEALSMDRFTLILFSGFAVLALLLAAIGIYGVMAFSVTQRSHEIAVRMALGATRHGIASLVMKEGLLLTGAGLSLGLIGADFVGRAMQSILYGVNSIGFAALSAVGLLLLLTALLACYLPAARATRDPARLPLQTHRE